MESRATTAVEGTLVTAAATAGSPRSIVVGEAGRVTRNDRCPGATDAIILPGLVNAHSHSGMSVLRGLGDGRGLEEWLEVVLAAENLLSQEDLRWALRLAMCEMIRSGITAFADMFYWDDELIGDVVEAGLRCAVAPTLFGPRIAHFQNASPLSYEAQLRATEDLHARWSGHDQIRVFYGPHAVYTAGERVFREVASRAADSGIPVHVHLSESATEVRECRKVTGRTPIQVAHDAGLLSETTLVAHAVHAPAEDIAILAATGATVSHNPASNLKLASGIAPVAEMLQAGVNVALGTDGPASADSLDILAGLRLAVSLQRGRTERPDALAEQDAMAIATVNGARGLGFETTQLGAGEPADLVVLKPRGPHATPIHSASAFVHWVASSRDVDTVIVGGKPLMLAGEIQTLDEDEIVYHVKAIARRLGASLSS